MTFPMKLDDCCVVSEHKDHMDVVHHFSGCESKILCKLPHLCRRCCDDQVSFLRGDRRTCNQRPNEFSHQCYRCKDCLMVSNALLVNQTNCLAEEGDINECFVYQNATYMVRGCFYKNWFRLNEMMTACMADIKNCHVCNGTLCNHDDMISYCYQCTYKNHNCRYDQRHVGYLQPCPNYEFKPDTPGTLRNPACVTMKK